MIWENAKSQPSASNALIDNLMAKRRVGIMSGNPKTGNKVEFLPALAEIAETNVKPAARPKADSSIAMAKRP